MYKRDYRPYCFDPCNEPLKTRYQQLIEAMKGKGSEIEVKVKVDEEMLNKAVEEAIKNNPVKVDVEVDLDDTKMVSTIEADFRKVHSHITCAENNIIESLSCNCDSVCNCGGNDCKCGKNDCKCNTKSTQLTKSDLVEAVTRINEHTDRKVNELAENIEEVETIIEDVQNSVHTIIEKVDNVETKVDDFRALYESYHN